MLKRSDAFLLIPKSGFVNPKQQNYHPTQGLSCASILRPYATVAYRVMVLVAPRRPKWAYCSQGKGFILPPTIRPKRRKSKKSLAEIYSPNNTSQEARDMNFIARHECLRKLKAAKQRDMLLRKLTGHHPLPSRKQ